MAPLGVVAVVEHGDGPSERCPDVVEIDACGHHPHDDLERARLWNLDLLELECVLRLALALGTDHPGGHRFGQVPRLDVEPGDRGEVYSHGPPSGFAWTGRILIAVASPLEGASRRS